MHNYGRAHIGDVIEPAALQHGLSLIFQQYKVSCKIITILPRSEEYNNCQMHELMFQAGGTWFACVFLEEPL